MPIVCIYRNFLLLCIDDEKNIITVGTVRAGAGSPLQFDPLPALLPRVPQTKTLSLTSNLVSIFSQLVCVGTNQYSTT